MSEYIPACVRFASGDFFRSAAALVNPVNCEGVMGAGLARQFAVQFPTYAAAYRQDCAKGVLRPGVITVYRDREPVIFSFPTKTTWRAPSQLAYVVSGLPELFRLVGKLNLPSVALPALGCGCGGLSWCDVRREILAAAASAERSGVISASTIVYIFPPHNYRK